MNILGNGRCFCVKNDQTVRKQRPQETLSIELVIYFAERMEGVSITHHRRRFIQHIEFQFQALFYLGGDSSRLDELLLSQQRLKVVHQGIVGNRQNRPNG